jgi:hypothetical protein
MKHIPTLLALATLLAACKTGPGEPCEVTGDGFTRYDPCTETCVDWQVTCPDGTGTVPDVCSAGSCSTDADCPSDYSCFPVGFVAECLPDAICEG